jgi:LytR cell envelope-related transcriptional attenuator
MADENEPQEPKRRNALLRIAGPSLAAVLAVWLMATLLGALNRPDDDETSALSKPSGGAVTAERNREASASPSQSRLVSPASSPSAPSVLLDAADAEADASSGAPLVPLLPALPDADDPAAVAPAPHPLPVYVLNQTTRPDLAAEVAEDIAAAGWSIAKVSWWRGVVPSTTVYYPPGYESAAQALSAAFPAIDRVRPAVDPMPDDALTVILCKEYPEV